MTRHPEVPADDTLQIPAKPIRAYLLEIVNDRGEFRPILITQNRKEAEILRRRHKRFETSDFGNCKTVIRRGVFHYTRPTEGGAR